MGPVVICAFDLFDFEAANVELTVQGIYFRLWIALGECPGSHTKIKKWGCALILPTNSPHPCVLVHIYKNKRNF